MELTKDNLDQIINTLDLALKAVNEAVPLLELDDKELRNKFLSTSNNIYKLRKALNKLKEADNE